MNDIKRIRFNNSDIYKILIVAAFAGVIISPSIAFNGALSGLKLWSVVVLPSLFPALVITTCILRVFPMKRSVVYIYIIIAGIFCGLPIGAILCAKHHKVDNTETMCDRIMGFCNLSSPSFVMNYLIYSNIGGRYSVYKTLMCIYMPVLEIMVFIILRYRKDLFNKSYYNTCVKNNNNNNANMSIILDEAIMGSVKNMLKLCGYIVVFSCLASYISRIPINSYTLLAVVCGFTEITNGIYMLGSLNLDIRLVVLLMVVVNASGGLSTLMQTSGMISGSGLLIKKYIYEKLIFTLVTLCNCLLIIYVL